MARFQATHEIKAHGKTIRVQFVDGALYTRREWEAGAAADWEIDDTGVLHFQGQDPLGACSIRRLGELTRDGLSSRYPEATIIRGWILDGAGLARFGWGATYPSGRTIYLGRTLAQAGNNILD